MRTAAAILRLGLAAASATKKISMRRSSSSAKKKGTGMESEKRLYLCFGEKCFYSVNQVVRPIRLKDIDYYDDDEEEYLAEAVYKTTSECIGEWRFPGRFGSQILFPLGGTHINRVDTTSWPIELENFTTDFSSPKIDPMLVELDGKLYCIDKDNRHRPLEVLDDDDFKWRPVDNPPFSIKGRGRPLCTLGSNKILAWEQGKAGVYCFDVTMPENGWKETAFSLDTHPDYEFVHLGGQKVCLVLNKYFDDKNTGILLLITFRYAVINNYKLSEVDIMPTILWTRHFRYHPVAVDEETLDLKLTGAFVL